MVGRRKQNKAYYFTVEGQTELLYLKWLETVLNECQNNFHIIFHCRVEQRPFHYAKTISTLTTSEVIHVCDIEGSSASDLKKFESVLDQMKHARQSSGIRYVLAYSNLDFELWMVLHKADANQFVSNKQQYLGMINRAYGTSFDSLDQYKEKDTFNNLLKQLNITHVLAACKRADQIMQRRKEISHSYQHVSYTYYLDNPSTSVHVCIGKIIKEAGILKNKRNT